MIAIIPGILSYGSKRKIIPIIDKTIIQPPPVGIGFIWLLRLFGISNIFLYSKKFYRYFVPIKVNKKINIEKIINLSILIFF